MGELGIVSGVPRGSSKGMTWSRFKTMMKIGQEKGPPLPADFTDLTIQAMARQAARRGIGSRRASFLTGPWGEKTEVPPLGKSFLTGG